MAASLKQADDYRQQVEMQELGHEIPKNGHGSVLVAESRVGKGGGKGSKLSNQKYDYQRFTGKAETGSMGDSHSDDGIRAIDVEPIGDQEKSDGGTADRFIGYAQAT